MRFAILGLLLLTGLLIRAREIDQPIVRFHPTRHYRSAVLARACYYDHVEDAPAWARRVADANRDMQQAGEPPLMEWMACAAYLMTGRENVTIPRVAAAAIWVSGAIPLWLLAGRLASATVAPLAVALYLFLPYGIIASRNFQPDALMTVAVLWALHSMIRHGDAPSRGRQITAAVLLGVAGVIKPMSVFLTVPVAMIMGQFTIAAVGLLPPLTYYGYEAMAGSLVQDQMRMRFEPHLLATGFFWNGLANMISRVETVPLFVLWLLAIPLATARRSRLVMMALLGGYSAFAAVFTYHMPTHDYYHLPYIAVVALAAALVAARIADRLPSPLIYAACVAIAVAGSATAWPQLQVPNSAMFSKMYREIGELAQHDVKALFLDTEYGFALMYHAELSGDSWPNQDDLAAEAFDGRPAIDAAARFDRDYADWQPTYFIVTDLASLDASPDLQRLLARRATPVRITDLFQVHRFHQ